MIYLNFVSQYFKLDYQSFKIFQIHFIVLFVKIKKNHVEVVDINKTNFDVGVISFNRTIEVISILINIFRKGKIGESYNVGTGFVVNNIKLVQKIMKIYYSSFGKKKRKVKIISKK